MDKLKQTKNLFKKLIKDEKSVFYAADISLCEKDKVFYKCYLDLEDKNVLYKSEKPKAKIPFYTPFVEQRKDIDRSSALYSIKASFELVHADVADIRFFSKSAVDPKYCLLAVDLFTSKTYVYLMKNKSFS